MKKSLIFTACLLSCVSLFSCHNSTSTENDSSNVTVNISDQTTTESIQSEANDTTEEQSGDTPEPSYPLDTATSENEKAMQAYRAVIKNTRPAYYYYYFSPSNTQL